jgi:Ser/Thr protein kinase RdoA (MazF antagonist)
LNELHAAFAPLDSLLDAWAVGPALAAYAPPTGTINATLLVDTPGGAYALRAYLRADADGIAREHGLIAHAAHRGLPAVAPLPLPDGVTALERSGLRYALFPHAPGQQVGRAELGHAHAAAMGRCLAELHGALVDAPPQLARARPLEFDRAATLALIERYLELAHGDTLLMRHLEGQRHHLQANEGPAEGLESLPQQVIHGDFTETNLFFADGAVSAIIDWENNYVAPRAWEVVRTLDLVFGFDPALCAAFATGYGERARLRLAELDRAAAAYGQMRAHDLWIFDAILVRGDRRPRRFINHAGFLPIQPRWQALRPHLSAR